MTERRCTWEDHFVTELQHKLITEHDMPGWLWNSEARECIKKALLDFAKEKQKRKRVNA